MLLKKIILVNLLLVSFLSSASDDGTHPGPLMFLDQHAIDRHRMNIETELKRATKLKVLIGLTGLIATGYAGYKLFGPVDASVMQPVVLSTDQCAFSPEQMHISLNKFHALASKLNSVEHQTWWQWIKNTVVQQYVIALFYGLASGTLAPITKYFTKLDQAVDRAVDKIFFKADVNWYIRSHTTLFNTGLLLNSYAEHVSETKDALIVTWNLCIKQLEGIVGFIGYKENILQSKEPYHAEQLKLFEQRITQKINDYTTQLHEMFATHAWQSIRATLVKFNEDIHSWTSECGLIEG